MVKLTEGLIIMNVLQCSSIPPVHNLVQQTSPSQPTKLMILGPACSVATELMGEIAERFMNIPQVWHQVAICCNSKCKPHNSENT